MGAGSKLHHLSWLFLVGILLLAACGDTVIASNGTVASATSNLIATVTANPNTAPPTKEAVATEAATAAAGSSADTPDPQKVAAGETVFVMQCQSCHFNGGKSSAGPGPNLAFSRKSLDPKIVTENVRKGEEGMTAFDKTKISDADLENVIQYLKSIHE